MRDHLTSFAEQQRRHRACKSKSPAPTPDSDARQAQDLGREVGDQDRSVEAHLGYHNSLLHARISKKTMPKGPVEGARSVGPHVLSKDKRNEGNGPRSHERTHVMDILLQNVTIAEVHESNHVDGKDYQGENNAVHQNAYPHPAKHHWLIPWTRPLLQDGCLSRLHTKGNGWRKVSDQDEEKDLQRRPHWRDAGNNARENLHYLRDVNRHNESHKLLDPRVDSSALLDSRDDGAEVVVCQDHVCGTFCHLGALDAHGNPDVGLVQCGRVVHTVACHRTHEALPLERPHDFQLVLGLSTCKNSRVCSKGI